MVNKFQDFMMCNPSRSSKSQVNAGQCFHHSGEILRDWHPVAACHLLHEKMRCRCGAVVAQVVCPLQIHRASAGAAFSAAER
jgi:hypothetical protein